jgi:hypothetical protein
MAALLAAGGLAAGLGAGMTGIAHASDPTRPDRAPLVALPCAGFQDAGQLLELG